MKTITVAKTDSRVFGLSGVLSGIKTQECSGCIDFKAEFLHRLVNI